MSFDENKLGIYGRVALAQLRIHEFIDREFEDFDIGMDMLHIQAMQEMRERHKSLPKFNWPIYNTYIGYSTGFSLPGGVYMDASYGQWKPEDVAISNECDSMTGGLIRYAL